MREQTACSRVIYRLYTAFVQSCQNQAASMPLHRQERCFPIVDRALLRRHRADSANDATRPDRSNAVYGPDAFERFLDVFHESLPSGAFGFARVRNPARFVCCPFRNGSEQQNVGR